MNDARLHHQADYKENIIMTTLSMTTLNYSITEPALRSPVEEWQPHAKQSESTTEWWYLTALVHDTTGNPYFLVWCPFHFMARAHSPPARSFR
jgi:predicted secreted hydrolase